MSPDEKLERAKQIREQADAALARGRKSLAEALHEQARELKAEAVREQERASGLRTLRGSAADRRQQLRAWYSDPVRKLPRKVVADVLELLDALEAVCGECGLPRKDCSIGRR